MSKYILFVWGIFLFPYLVFSQSDDNTEIAKLYQEVRSQVSDNPTVSDSLLQTLKNKCKASSNNTCNKDSLNILQADIYHRLAYKNIGTNVDSSRAYNAKSRSLYLALKNKKGLSASTFAEAKIYTADGKYHEAIQEFDNYISNLNKAEDQIDIAKAEYEKSSCHQRIGFQDSAMACVLRAVPIFEKEGLRKDLANSYGAIGIINKSLSQFDEAKKYLIEARDIYIEIENKIGENRMIGNLANTMYAEGDTLGAIEHFKIVAQKAEETNDLRTQALVNLNISNAYYQIKQYDSATTYIDKAIVLSDGLGARMKYMMDYKKGAIDIEQGETQRGIGLLENAYAASIELKSYIDARDMAHYLDLGYATSGDFKMANKYSRKFSELKDSVITIESNKTINELKTKYETEKNELKIQNLELTTVKQQQRITGISIALALFSILSFFLFKLYQKVNQQKTIINKALKEKEILLKEIHHRVKNNLQLVSSLLTMQSRSIDDPTAIQAINEGKNRVRSMALIHQDLYNKENITGIGVKQYLEKLSKEIFATYRIDTSRLLLQLDIQDIDLDIDTLVPLGLIINELITNSLKYAFPQNQKGNMYISLQDEGSTLKLKVTDDGIGYNPLDIKENSFGSTLISALTEQLEGNLKMSHDEGTKMELTFKEYKVV